jgi:fatty acid desaturase
MPVHEGSHASTTSSPIMWRLMGAIHDWVNGASFYNWCHQHFLGHHPFTNVTDTSKSVDALDPDVVTNDPDVRRIKPTQSHRDYYKYQVFYAPVLYGLLGLKFRINDFMILFVHKKNGHVRVNPMNNWHLFNFFGGKAFFVFYRIIVPAMFFMPLWQSISLFIWSDLVTSWILAFVFQVNHVVPHAKWPMVNKETGMVNMDWAEMQIMTTLDYAHDSWITTFLTGALNYQVTHHLFPYISQIHYPEIAPIIREHCKEYRIHYTVLPTFYDAFKAHLTYLAKMGHAHYDF